MICGDMNARTAEEIDYVRIADLQDFIDVPGNIDELPALWMCTILLTQDVLLATAS